VAIFQRPAQFEESIARFDNPDKSASAVCFNDWMRFCVVLREIASKPLSGLEAHKRAQAVLAECGYTWPGRAEVEKPTVVGGIAEEGLSTQVPANHQLTSAGTKQKSQTKAQSPRRRSDPRSGERRRRA
jgi:hypothetical protein